LELAVRHLRRMAGSPAAHELADAQLLERYVASHDGDAFAMLVCRYGRLVRSVCRHVLHQEQDVDDAFQATFMVFALKAASIRKTLSVASWLYGVAFRTAMNARRSRSRRREVQRKPEGCTARQPIHDAALREIQALLDDELNQLPEKYRAPFVLCCLEGKSRSEAAQELGWKEGTVLSRLSRARKMLQARLTRRGVALSAALAAVELSRTAVGAAVTPRFVNCTIEAALSFAAGRPVDLVSADVVALAKGALKSMLVAKWKIATALLVAVGLCGTAAGTLTYGTPADDKQAPQPSLTQKEQNPPADQSRVAKPNQEEQQKALADFAQRYALKPGEIVKRIPVPFPPSRFVYHRQHYPKDDKAEDMMFLQWDNGLHFVGTIGGMKSDPHKVQLLFLFQYLPTMLREGTADRELPVRGDADLLCAAVDGDFVFRANVPLRQIVDKMGEILRNECHVPVQLTLLDDEVGKKGRARTLWIERDGPAAPKPVPSPSADYVLTEKDKDIPKPSFEWVDYSKPKAYLVLDKSLGNPDRIRKIAASLNGPTPDRKIIAISKWIDSHLKHDDACAYAWRDFDAIVDDGRYGGCADHAVVFGALLRACDIPCVWVKTMDVDWIREFVGNHGRCRNWRGHVYLEVYLHDRWMLLDATQLVLYENYQTTDHFFPGNRYAYDKGGNPYDLILSSRWDLWKKQTAAHFLHFDLNRLPLAFQQGKNLRDQGGVFITTITKMDQGDWTATWQQTSERCTKLGFPVRLSFRGDYARILPRTKGNYLIVTCIGDQLVLDEQLCATYLPWSLADLQTRLGRETQGLWRGQTRDGTRVVLVFAKDRQTLRAMIEKLTLE
jgi:RNA polymerase sigma factor (sigma-70 family)